MVSSTPALSSGIRALRNAFVRLDQARTEPWWLGQQIYENAAAEYDQFAPMYAHQRVAQRILDWQRPQRPPFARRDLPWSRVGLQSSMQGWRLRQGEGLAVVYGAVGGLSGAALTVRDVQPNGHQNFDFVATFTRERAVNLSQARARALIGLG